MLNVEVLDGPGEFCAQAILRGYPMLMGAQDTSAATPQPSRIGSKETYDRLASMKSAATKLSSEMMQLSEVHFQLVISALAALTLS